MDCGIWLLRPHDVHVLAADVDMTCSVIQHRTVGMIVSLKNLHWSFPFRQAHPSCDRFRTSLFQEYRKQSRGRMQHTCHCGLRRKEVTPQLSIWAIGSRRRHARRSRELVPASGREPSIEWAAR